MQKIALLVNEPPPYRIPVFNLLAATPGLQVRVIFCCRREPNRLWNLPAITVDHVFLRERIRTVNGRYIHNNPDVVAVLSHFDPDVVISNGFNPTHLYALCWAVWRRKAYVPMTDGTLDSEQALSSLHKRLRRFTYARSAAYIAASNGGLALYQSYGVDKIRCFKSCLCTDNARFQNTLPIASEKSFDFIFCGRIESAKNPDFALQVARHCAKLLGRPMRILFVGSGSAEPATRLLAAAMGKEVVAHFHGFANQQELPALYQSARIFLFPTRADVWGVVANEACAAGLPVLVSPYAGVAGELIVEGQNGFVCELDINLWAARAASLLQDEKRLQGFGERSRLLVGPYRFEQAAQGIIDASLQAQAHQTAPVAVSRPL